MASPPSLSLPNKRPASAFSPTAASPPSSSPTSTQPPAKRRKPSTAFSSSNLRQSSFPPDSALSPPALSPADSATPGGLAFSREASIDSSVRGTGPGSLLSGKGAGVGRGRKKGKRGQRQGTAATSELNGKAGQIAGGEEGGVEWVEDMPEEKEEDDADLAASAALATLEGGQMSEAQKKQEKKHIQMLLERFSDVEMDRYVLWKRFKINKAHVRRLINYSLSQSVPAGIVTAVNGCAKIFVVDLIERALDVQMEWQAAAAKRPNGDEVANDADIKDRTMMIDRGPLTPDHLREALRRYKKERTGLSAGVMGVSLKGMENVAPKGAATKNLFRKM